MSVVFVRALHKVAQEVLYGVGPNIVARCDVDSCFVVAGDVAGHDEFEAAIVSCASSHVDARVLRSVSLD